MTPRGLQSEAVTCLLSITQSGAVNVPVYVPAVGLPASFLLVQTWLGCHYRSVHVPGRARAWACTCLSVHLSLPSEEAVLLMDVCLWIRLEDVLFPVSRDGTFREQELKMQEWECESEEQVTSLTDCVRDLCSLKHLESVLDLNPAQDCSGKHP